MIGTLGDRLPRAWLQVGQVFGGMFARNLLRGLFKLLLAGILTPAAMGVLRSTQSLWRILGAVADLGLTHTVTVFVPPAIRRGDDDERDRTLLTVLAMLLAVAGILIVLALIAAGPLARWALGDPSLEPYARLAVLAAAGRLLWKFGQSELAARQQFGRLGLYLSTGPVLMVVVGGALALAGLLTLNAAVWITLLTPTATLALWWWTFDRGYVRRSNWDGALARRILAFSRWVYLTSIGSSLRGHLNPLLLKNPALSGSIQEGAASAGLYGFGNDMANELQMLSGSVATVLMPKATRLQKPAELRRYVLRAYRGILALVVLLAPLCLLARPALELLGRVSPRYLEYLPSIPVFMILYAGGLLAIAMIPMSTVLYALRIPEVETRIELAMVVVLIVGGLMLIPPFGSIGAAVTVAIQRFLALVLTSTYTIHRLWWRADRDAS